MPDAFRKLTKTMTHHLVTSNNCVFLTCEGNFSKDEMILAWREVQLILAELGCKRILVDVTALQSVPDTAELFDLAKLFWLNFPQTGRMALVVRWDQSALAKLLETLLRSVGVYVTIFVSKEMAKAWIGEDSNELPPQSSAQKRAFLLLHPAHKTLANASQETSANKREGLP